MAYDLARLGYLQFQQVCTELLALEEQVDPALWVGDADRHRWVMLDRPSGAEIVLCVWQLSPSYAPTTRIGHQLGRTPASRARVLLSVAPEPGALAHLQQGRTMTIELCGPADLAPRIDALSELRRRCPALLGVRDLAPLIDGTVAGRSSLDTAAATELARVFVATGAYARARTVLSQHHFAVLTGPPEMGKTAIARMLALAQLTEGWEAHECTAPEQLFAAHDPTRAQVFVADDAFGSTEYRSDRAERWARDMERILRGLDHRHWLIWTSRPAPLRAGLDRIHRERGGEHFPSPGAVLVDASALTVPEKALILFRHAKQAQFARTLRHTIRDAGPAIVAHRHFTPERIRRLVAALDDAPEATPDLPAVAERALSRASEAMAASYRALEDEHRALLIALLDVPPGPAGERELAAAVRRHHPGGLSRPPAALIDRLGDHFLRLDGRRVSWVHPSWRDLVIDGLRVDDAARRAFLQVCAVDGALLALSVGGGAEGERTLPLLVDDADWDALTDRVRELEPDEILAVLGAASAARRAPEAVARAGGELDALARGLLGRLVAVWRGSHAAIAPAALAAWHAAAERLADPPSPPALAETWVELVPTRVPDLSDHAAVEQLVDWLDLVGVMERVERRQLRQLLQGSQAPTYVRLFFGALPGAGADGAWLHGSELASRLFSGAEVLFGTDGLLGEELTAVARVFAPRRAALDRWPDDPSPLAEIDPDADSGVRRVLRDL